jgi:hypothetical protein
MQIQEAYFGLKIAIDPQKTHEKLQIMRTRSVTMFWIVSFPSVGKSKVKPNLERKSTEHKINIKLIIGTDILNIAIC